MAAHSLVVTDLAGKTRAFLEGYGLKLTRILNGACRLEFTAATDDPKARELLIGSRAVKLYRNGVLRFFGVIAEPFIDGATEVQITAYDPFYFLGGDFLGLVRNIANQRILSSASYGATDAGAIAWDLIGAPGIETHLREGTIETSVARDRDYAAGKSIGDAVTELAAVEDGFFFRIDALDAAGAGFATFNVLYPDAGVDRPFVRFEYGDGTLANIAESGLQVQRFMPVNEVLAAGSGDTAGYYGLPFALATDAGSQAEYGVLPLWVDLSNVTDQATLAQTAAENVKAHPPIAVQFDAMEGAPALFDDFDVGDTVHVHIDNGRTLVDGPVRVNQATLEVDDETGAERLSGLVLESPTLQAQEAR